MKRRRCPCCRRAHRRAWRRLPAALLLTALVAPPALPAEAPLPDGARHRPDTTSSAAAAPRADNPGARFAHAVPLTAARAAASPDPAVWRVANRCGVNALYAYLSLHGHRVAYTQLLDDVPIGADGTSLLELKQAAVRHGADVQLLKATPASLPTLLPAIVHREGEQMVSGHYDLALSIDADSVTMIDGTGGAVCRVPLAEFQETWTGYVLAPAPPRRAFRAAVPLMVLGVALAAAWSAYPWARRALRGASAAPNCRSAVPLGGPPRG